MSKSKICEKCEIAKLKIGNLKMRCDHLVSAELIVANYSSQNVIVLFTKCKMEF